MKLDRTFPNGSTLSQPCRLSGTNLGRRSHTPHWLCFWGKDVEKALEPFVTRPRLCLDASDDQWSWAVPTSDDKVECVLLAGEKDLFPVSSSRSRPICSSPSGGVGGCRTNRVRSRFGLIQRLGRRIRQGSLGVASPLGYDFIRGCGKVRM
jgi:hypothetical protein